MLTLNRKFELLGSVNLAEVFKVFFDTLRPRRAKILRSMTQLALTGLLQPE